MQRFLETERLLLRRFTAADGDDLFALYGDPDVMRFLNGGMPTPRDMIEQETLPRILRSYTQGSGFGVWAAIEKATGAFLGWFSLMPSHDHGPEEATLGYRLHTFAWGKGYGTEGACALIHTGFTALGVQRVVATTYQENRASRRVMEKLGMTLVRTYRLTAADLSTEGADHVVSETVWDGDDVEYALTKADWEQAQDASALLEETRQ